MKKIIGLILCGSVLLAACATSRPALKDQIIFLPVVHVPDFSLENFSNQTRSALAIIQQEGASPRNVGLITAIEKGAPSEKATEQDRKNLNNYLEKAQQEYEAQLVREIEAFFNGQKEKVKFEKYNRADVIQILSAFEWVYMGNPQDARFAKWENKLDKKSKNQLYKSVPFWQARYLKQVTARIVQQAEYPEVNAEYEEVTLKTLARHCGDMVWYAAVPHFAVKMLDTLPGEQVSSPAKNYQQLHSGLEQLRLNIWPIVTQTCNHAVEETKRYFNNQELEDFLVYSAAGVLPGLQDPDVVYAAFSYSKTPYLKAKTRVTQTLNSKMVAWYMQDPEKFGTNYKILLKLMEYFKQDWTEQLEQARVFVPPAP